MILCSIKRISMVLLLLLTTVALYAQHRCDTVVFLRDTTVLPGQSVTMQAHSLFEYTWQPESAFANPHDSLQTISPNVTTDYIVIGRYISENIVSNGDFESGNSGIVSGYTYWNTNSNTWGVIGAEGTYTINTSSANVHNNFGTHVCIDHTYANGTGQCMYVNGATTPGVTVWTQVIDDIFPNTDYIFITWVATLAEGMNPSASSLARLQFSINGVTIGNIFTAPSMTAQWQQFYQIWNSGNATSATISILNQNTEGGGNDFALDDISFSPMYTCEDTVTVHVDYPINAHSDTVRACRGDTQTINPLQNDEIDAVCGTLGTVLPEMVQAPEHANVSFLPNGNVQIQFATDFVGTEVMYYRICCGTTCDTAAIVLISTGFESEFSDTACFQYSWNGIIYVNSGDYQQTLTASNNCDSIVTLHLTILQPTVNISTSNSFFCETHEATLEAQGDMEEYVWSTGEFGPTIMVTEPGIYSVTGSNDFCNVTAQFTVPYCDFTVYIPNTITPGIPDGLNDFLSLNDYVKPEIMAFEIIIYDRHGSIVFASVDKDFVWNGTVRNKLIQNITYTYIVKYKNKEGQEVLLKGSILVL